MTTSTAMTAGEASKATGKATATITRAIKSGRLSARPLDGKPGYAIEPAELFRVFPPKGGATDAQPLQKAEMKEYATPRNPSNATGEIDALKLLIAEKDKTIERLEADKLRERELGDEARSNAKGLQLQLTHQQQQDEEQAGRGWWSRTFGKNTR